MILGYKIISYIKYKNIYNAIIENLDFTKIFLIIHYFLLKIEIEKNSLIQRSHFHSFHLYYQTVLNRVHG